MCMPLRVCCDVYSLCNFSLVFGSRLPPLLECRVSMQLLIQEQVMFYALTGLTNFDYLVGTSPDSAYLGVQHRKFMTLSLA
jgi:hypothetical protein